MLALATHYVHRFHTEHNKFYIQKQPSFIALTLMLMLHLKLYLIGKSLVILNRIEKKFRLDGVNLDALFIVIH